MSKLRFRVGNVSPVQGVAAAVLIIVLWCVFPSSTAKKPSSSVATATSANASAESLPDTSNENVPDPPVGVSQSVGGEEIKAVRVATPTVLEDLSPQDLKQLEDADPFASLVAQPVSSLPETAPAPDDSATKIRVDEVRNSDVSLVYTSSRGTSAAIVNAEVVRPGTILKGGLAVETIHEHGVAVRIKEDLSSDRPATDDETSVLHGDSAEPVF